jgi:hypothetical protein
MNQIQGIVIFVGTMGLGFYGKPNLENSSQAVSEHSISQGAKSEVRLQQNELREVSEDESKPALTVAECPANTRQEMQSNYNKIATSFFHKDPTIYLGYLTPTFTAINHKGERANLRQVRKNHEMVLKQAKFLQVKIAITKIDWGNDASMASVLLNKSVYGLMHNHQVVVESSIQDLWVKNTQGWRLNQSHNLSQQITLDGIRMPAS